MRGGNCIVKGKGNCGSKQKQGYTACTGCKAEYPSDVLIDGVCLECRKHGRRGTVTPITIPDKIARLSVVGNDREVMLKKMSREEKRALDSLATEHGLLVYGQSEDAKKRAVVVPKHVARGLSNAVGSQTVGTRMAGELGRLSARVEEVYGLLAFYSKHRWNGQTVKQYWVEYVIQYVENIPHIEALLRSKQNELHVDGHNGAFLSGALPNGKGRHLDAVLKEYNRFMRHQTTELPPAVAELIHLLMRPNQFGGAWRNEGNILPAGNYTEWHATLLITESGRSDPERLVRDASKGVVYYTPNHYGFFVRVQ